jgi:8-oxo-dGTP diphosphatase
MFRPVSAIDLGMTDDRLKLPVAVHLFLFKDGKVLLLRRQNTGFEDGKFSVPAGHLDGNETVQEAAARELLEEVGLQVEARDMSVVGVMHRKSLSERIDFFLTPKAWQGSPENQEPSKCDLVQWTPLSALPRNMVGYVRHALEQCLEGRWFMEFGWDRRGFTENATKI